ncbi:MAG: Mur ligase family protein, partial [Bacillota bacterium]|nr:Mur ligase family protein [Bacillota bacterium]
MMNYTESLQYMRELTKFGFNFGLDRVLELLRRLGDPHKTMKYIHIGGTNGKGSITSMLNSMLTSAGEKPGMFTSPHLHSYRERFRIGGEMISYKDVAKILNEIKPHIEAMIEDGFEQPTEFEVNTVLAFTYFAQKGVKTAVMEVGMGGEIDATNVIENVKVAVMTNIALEHTEYLGHTKEEICATKSGIIKENSHLVTGITEENLLDFLGKKARSVKAKSISVVNKDFFVSFEKETPEGQWFSYEDENTVLKDLFIPLQGKHQLTNAALAVRAALLWGLKEDDIRKGLKCTVWPCRLEKVLDNPVAIIDGAHNDHGMAVLTDFLKEHYSDKKITVL